MEKVRDDRFVANEMVVPSLAGSFCLRLVGLLLRLNVRLLALAEQVLAQKVKDRVNALVRVVLTVASESWSILTKNALKHRWCYSVAVHVPHLIDELSICHN